MHPLPNTAEGQLAQVIRRVCGAGFEGALHEWFRRCVAPDNLIILAYRNAGPPQVLFRQSDKPQVFSQLDTTYLAGAYLLDPYHDLHVTRVPTGAYRLRDVAPDAFHRSRYFLDYYQQTTLIDEITFVCYPRPEVSLNICLGRDSTSALSNQHQPPAKGKAPAGRAGSLIEIGRRYLLTSRPSTWRKISCGGSGGRKAPRSCRQTLTRASSDAATAHPRHAA